MTSSSRLTQHGLSLQGVPNVDVPRFNAWPFPMEMQHERRISTEAQVERRRIHTSRSSHSS
eukprot:4027449-Amphidinium_carterae.1